MSSTPIERLRRMVDGVGHLGGGIGVLIIAPQIPNMSVLGAMLLVSGFLVAADARWRRREPPRAMRRVYGGGNRPSAGRP